MRICLICAEFFGWGTRGGFGYATRMLGRELAKRDVEVVAVVPRPTSEAESEIRLDGVRVIGVERNRLWDSQDIFRQVDADIYHSQNPSLLSAMAQRAQPARKHVATMRDPRSLSDWWTEFSYPTHAKIQVIKSWLFYQNPWTIRAIRNMDALYVPANFLAAKCQQLYGIEQPPGLMPTPVDMPERVQKSIEPRAIFVGRWDRVKRPELFFELAERVPEVQFVAVGKAHNLNYEAELRNKYGERDNLAMLGYIDQFSSDRLSRELAKSWMLINTSAKEALPNTFVEAAAHRCAIVAALDPDQFTSRFGRLVNGGNFADAVRDLLEGDRWRALGEAAYLEVVDRNGLDASSQRHIDAYNKLLS